MKNILFTIIFLSCIMLVFGADKKYTFKIEPKDNAKNQLLETVVVHVVDSTTGDIDTSMNGYVSLELRSLDGTAVLSGTKKVQAVNGVATFTNLSIDTSYQGARLVAYSAPIVLSNWDGSTGQYADVWPVKLNGKDYAFVGVARQFKIKYLVTLFVERICEKFDGMVELVKLKSESAD